MNSSSWQSPFILTIDVGSSSLRALMFDVRGSRLPGIEARRSLQMHTASDGAAEFDPEALLARFFEAIDEALDQAGNRANDIAGVAVDTFVSNLMGVDAASEAVTPLLTYADAQAADEDEGVAVAVTVAWRSVRAC